MSYELRAHGLRLWDLAAPFPPYTLGITVHSGSKDPNYRGFRAQILQYEWYFSRDTPLFESLDP